MDLRAGLQQAHEGRIRSNFLTIVFQYEVIQLGQHNVLPHGLVDDIVVVMIDAGRLRRAASGGMINAIGLQNIGVRAFVADRSPHAYERLIDRLLASPRYAEMQTMRWLDAVRYGDSAGFFARVL